MSTLPELLDRCCDVFGPPLEDVLPEIANYVPSSVSLSDLLRVHLGPYLTHADGKVRTRTTALLAGLLQRGGPAMLVYTDANPVAGKSPACSVSTALVGFFCGRLADVPSMAPAAEALVTLLDTLSEFAADDAASQVSRTIFGDIAVPALDYALRFKILSILCVIVRSPRWIKDVSRDTKAFCTGVVLAVEGEKDPRCLVLVLELVQRTLRECSGALSALEGGNTVLEELFDVCACYFPISFNPPPNNPHGITREGLVNALQGVLASTYRIAPMVMPLLFEKLSSSIVSAKLDSLTALQACAIAYGPTALLPFVREACDALRGEVMHASDEIVTRATLETISALVRVVSGHADATTLTGPSPSLPGWSDIDACLVQVSSGDLTRAPDSLLGKSGAAVLAAVASASGLAFCKVLNSVMGLVPVLFAATRKQEGRTASAVALEAITKSIPAAAFSHSAWCDVSGLLGKVFDALLSVLAAPGECEPACVSSSMNAAVNIALAWPQGPSLPSEFLVSHIVNLITSNPDDTVRESGAACLGRLCCNEALCTLVIRDAIPRLLNDVEPAVELGNKPEFALKVLTSLSDRIAVYSVVVPALIEKCRLEGDIAIDSAHVSIIRAVVGIVTHSQAIRSEPKLVSALTQPSCGLVHSLLTAFAHNDAALSLCYDVLRTVSLYGPADVQNELREYVVSCVLSPGKRIDHALFPRQSVPLAVSLCWLQAVLCTAKRDSLIPKDVMLLDALITIVVTGADSAAACACVAVVANRLSKNAAYHAIINGKLRLLEEVVNSTGADLTRIRALHALIAALKGVFMAGYQGEGAVNAAFATVCGLLQSSDDACSAVAGSDVSALFDPSCDALTRENGAFISPVYQQRVFGLLAKLSVGLIPGMLTGPLLQALCGLFVRLPHTVLAEHKEKMLPIVLVALGNSIEDVQVKAVAALKLLTAESVDALLPHLSSVVPTLIDIGCKSSRAVIRAEAIDCLRSFVSLPFHHLNVLRPVVVRGLLPALDDKKRGVRRRAAACRNDWITLSTTPV